MGRQSKSRGYSILFRGQKRMKWMQSSRSLKESRETRAFAGCRLDFAMDLPPPNHKEKQLLDLPTELLLHTFSYLNFSAVAVVRRCSSFLNQLISSSSELLFRRIAWATGLTEEAGVGASTAAGGRAVGGFGLVKLEEWWDEEELKRAISAQRSMSGMYDNVKSWEEFGELLSALAAVREAKELINAIPTCQPAGVSLSTKHGSKDGSKNVGCSSETLLIRKGCFASSWTPSRISLWPAGLPVRRSLIPRRSVADHTL